MVHSRLSPGQPGIENVQVYEIRIAGRLDPHWSDWLNGMEINLECEDPPLTRLAGPVVDQARLRGILNRIWDLNLTLVSLNQVERKESYHAND